MFCTNCGAKLPEGSKFCPKCGKPVTTAPNPESETKGKNTSPLFQVKRKKTET